MRRNVGFLGWLGNHWKSTAFSAAIMAAGGTFIAVNIDDIVAQREADRAMDEAKETLDAQAQKMSWEKIGVEPVLVEEHFRSVAEGIYKIKVDMKGESVECLVNAHSDGGNYREVTLEFCK